MTMRVYKALKKNEFVSDPYKLVPLRDEDKFFIMDWRNAQIDILRQQNPLTPEGQSHYFANVVARLFDVSEPGQLLFSFLKHDQLVGYGGLVHIRWQDRRAEVSFLLETERNKNIPLFQNEYAVFLNLIKEVAFLQLGFNKITTEAFDLRPFVIETLEKNDFVCEGVLRKHNVIDHRFVDSILHACFSTQENRIPS